MMNKTGMLICLTYHLPNVSGLTLSAHALARYLALQGHAIGIVASRHPADMPAQSEVDGVTVERCRILFRVGKAPVMPSYALAVWKAARDHEVINVHLPCLDAAAVAIAAKLRRRKLIVSYICSMSNATAAGQMSRAVAAMTHMVAGVLADSIHVPSQDYAEQSVFCRLFRRKVIAAPLFVPLQRNGDDQEPKLKRRDATPQSPFRIGFVGRISRQKSLQLLFEALPHLVEKLGPDVRLDLLGPAEDVIGEDNWKQVLAHAGQHGDQVRYHGVKHGADLAGFYAGLDVLVLPSMDRLESFGLVQVEAMLRGVPVVASDLPGMRTPVAVTGMGRLFAPGDATALASTIADVLQNGPPKWLTADQINEHFGAAAASLPYRRLLD
jgi:glycosyltransferase involved in cell wall biosynthesis